MPRRADILWAALATALALVVLRIDTSGAEPGLDGGPELLGAFPHERLRAEQPHLLGVGEQDHHGVPAGPGGTEGPGGLEQNPDGDSVVGGTRRAGNSVVVTGEDDGPGRGGARPRRDHVGDRGHRLSPGGTEVQHSD